MEMSNRPRPPRWHDFCRQDTYPQDIYVSAFGQMSVRPRTHPSDKHVHVPNLRRTKSKLDVDPGDKFATQWKDIYDVDHMRPESRCLDTCTGYCRLKHPASITKDFSQSMPSHLYNVTCDSDTRHLVQARMPTDNYSRCCRWIDEVHRARNDISSTPASTLVDRRSAIPRLRKRRQSKHREPS